MKETLLTAFVPPKLIPTFGVKRKFPFEVKATSLIGPTSESEVELKDISPFAENANVPED